MAGVHFFGEKNGEKKEKPVGCFSQKLYGFSKLNIVLA
jgi:hypothetical protein